MNKEQQRIAIAEACGWKITSDSPNWTYHRPDGRGWNGYLPDYPNDLNAIHEAENVLYSVQYQTYVKMIAGLLLPYSSDTAAFADFAVANATAAQRAEAFLRTIGKWEEAK